eukprot:TRINITY_DN8842_c0_g1_i1.p1 TRINITY_DN8842_c0_g1~~TRINITY_DN8842_c0_g1_i1.p1  ORF type:complete len:526 (-),score=92.02 TRINITY_DN8842_c0_g1_i1:119-1696(-)
METSRLLDDNKWKNQYEYAVPSDKYPNFGLLLMLFINFLSSISFSAILPSLWGYIKDIDEEARVATLGWAIALHSAGSLVASPLIVTWSQKRPLREILIATLTFMMIGGMMHALAGNDILGKNVHVKLGVLLASRAVIGAASANYIVTPTYISIVPVHQRYRIYSYNGLATLIAFIVGPLAASTTAYLRQDNQGKWWIFVFDEYRIPGLLIAVLAFITIVFTLVAPIRALRAKREVLEWNHRRYRYSTGPSFNNYMTSNNSEPLAPGDRSSTNSIDVMPYTNSTGSLSNYGIACSSYFSGLGSITDIPSVIRELRHNSDRIPTLSVIVCFCVYFLLTLSFTVWETVGAPLTEYFSWTAKQNGLLYASMGIGSLLTLLLLHYLTRVIAGRLLLCISCVWMAAGAILLLVHITTSQTWNAVLFCVAVALIAIGYSGGVNMVLHVYGKLQELDDLGILGNIAVSWFSVLGCLARVIGPIASAYILQLEEEEAHGEVGRKNVKGLLIFCLTMPATAFLATIISYKRLPP